MSLSYYYYYYYYYEKSYLKMHSWTITAVLPKLLIISKKYQLYQKMFKSMFLR